MYLQSWEMEYIAGKTIYLYATYNHIVFFCLDFHSHVYVL